MLLNSVSPSCVVTFVYFIVTSVSLVTVTGFPSLSTSFTVYVVVLPSFTLTDPVIIAYTLSSSPYPPVSVGVFGVPFSGLFTGLSKIVPIPSGLVIFAFPTTFEILIFIVSPLSDK